MTVHLNCWLAHHCIPLCLTQPLRRAWRPSQHPGKWHFCISRGQLVYQNQIYSTQTCCTSDKPTISTMNNAFMSLLTSRTSKNPSGTWNWAGKIWKNLSASRNSVPLRHVGHSLCDLVGWSPSPWSWTRVISSAWGWETRNEKGVHFLVGFPKIQIPNRAA